MQQELDGRRHRAPSTTLARIADDRTRALLEGLSPDQRDVMVLRIIGDLTIEQVADVLGKRPGAVKALQRRAPRPLRKKFSTRPYPSSDPERGRE